MSTHEWIPDKPKPSGEAKPTPTAFCLVVPRVNLGAKTANFNLAGWLDTGGNTYVCSTCKKRVPLSFQALVIYPTLKANLDSLQFLYQVGAHKKGGPFSKEACPESETRVGREYEQPTSVRIATLETEATKMKKLPTGLRA